VHLAEGGDGHRRAVERGEQRFGALRRQVFAQHLLHLCERRGRRERL
jgi:hypothetical protein